MDECVKPASKQTAPAPGWWQCLTNPSRKSEILFWVVLILSVIGIRAYLVHLVPVAFWSDDANSYAASAFKWVHQGVWSTDARRGPIYSLFIAACTKFSGSIHSVMIVQHVLGAISVLLAMAALRALHGRRMMVPIALCSYAYAVYGLPLYLEHLIRNETLLFFFSSVALVTWLFAILKEKPHFLWLSGIATGLLMCTKSVFGPFPALVVLGSLFYWRSTPKLAVKFAGIFCLAFLLPIAGVKLLKVVTHDKKPPQPQAGILLYARVAQFTRMDGGIAPEIKEQIRAEVEEYRQDYLSEKRKYNNNTIIYKTIVPHLRAILYPQGKQPADVNRLCKQLAIEAILHNKMAYIGQVLHDLQRIHTKGGYRLDSPEVKDLTSNSEKLQSIEKPDPILHVEQTVAVLDSRAKPSLFKTYDRWVASSWLFGLAPVLFTSPLLIWLLWRSRGKLQFFWIGAGLLWAFSMVLLSTVGRPLDRYLIPVAPVMFLTLSTAFIALWQWGLQQVGKKFNLPLPEQWFPQRQ